MNKEYKIYNGIINDFTKNVLKKNNITDPIEVFYLFCDLFNRMTFSKNTKLGSFFITEKDLVDDLFGQYEGITHNLSAELLSDKMVGLKNKEYMGMFMVNGDGVCRHINSMLADILKKLGYKTYKLYGPTNNGSINHLICGVVNDNREIIYLDAMKRKILYEEDKNVVCSFANLKCQTDKYSLGYNLKAIDYSMKAPYKINKFVFYKSRFNNYEEIIEYQNNLKLVKDFVYDDAYEFRIRHLDDFEQISKILHKKYDKNFK